MHYTTKDGGCGKEETECFHNMHVPSPALIQSVTRFSPRPLPQRHTYNFGFERRLNLPIFDLLPVDSTEEQVALDVLLPLGTASEALARILRQELQVGNIHS